MRRPDDVLLSAYIDGEMPDSYREEFEKALERDNRLRSRVEQLKRLRVALHAGDEPEVGAFATAAFPSIMRRVGVRARSGFVYRWQQVRLPLPAVASAAAVIIALAGVLTWSLLPKATEDPNYLTQGQDVDVTIRVEDAEMERVLDWLAERQMLGEISIELPEQQFRIVGEPVFLKPDELPEGFSE